MRETQVERVSPERPQTYRVNVAQPELPFDKQIAALTADINRLLGDIAQRLDRIEQRVTKLEKPA